MKHFAGSVATLLLAFGSVDMAAFQGANAEGTWVVVYKNFSKSNPGTLGWEMNIGGLAYWVDVRSLVRRADMAYFNISSSILDRNGNFPSNEVHSGTGWMANCSTQKIQGPSGGWKSWSDPSNAAYAAIGDFVCN